MKKSVSIDADIYNKIREIYIDSFNKNTLQFVGIELEFPIINYKENYERNIGIDVLNYLVDEHGFIKDENEEYKIINKHENDIISLEYSCNTIEFTMEKSKSLIDIENRFKKYFSIIQEFLSEGDYTLSGFGMHPHWNMIKTNPVDKVHYQMVEKYLKRALNINRMHNHFDFCSYISSVQTHIDTEKEKIPDVIQFLSFISGIKAMIFSNSIDITKSEEFINMNCVRDYMWWKSMFAYHDDNIGYYEGIRTMDEIIESIARRTMYYTKRGNSYISFEPIRLSEYLKKEYIVGENSKNNECVDVVPEYSDIEYFRSYKAVEITKRGTIEIRDDCQQPVYDCFAPSAFCIGLIKMFEKSRKLTEQMCMDMDIDYYSHRKNRILGSMDDVKYDESYTKRLETYINKFIEIAEEGLKLRGYGEEVLLKNLKGRKCILDSPAKRIRKALEDNINLKDIISEYSKVREE